MKCRKYPPRVEDFLDEFVRNLRNQLQDDFLRWGDTWLKRNKEGQELRTETRYNDYFDQFEEAGIPVPWLKIIGGALICWIRDNHPEVCPDANERDDEGMHISVEKYLGLDEGPKIVTGKDASERKTVQEAINDCGENWGQPDHQKVVEDHND